MLVLLLGGEELPHDDLLLEARDVIYLALATVSEQVGRAVGGSLADCEGSVARLSGCASFLGHC